MEGYRPPIRATWNPAVSFLITSCWRESPQVRFHICDFRSSLRYSHEALGSTQLRLGLEKIISSLSMIMKAGDSLITVANTDTSEEKKSEGGDIHLAPGALWQRVETDPMNIELGDVIGQGSYSKVHRCRFLDKLAACKIFRNTTDESAFKEIEMMFSLRHPNIIGLFAWFQLKGMSRLWIMPTAYFAYSPALLSIRDAHANRHGRRACRGRRPPGAVSGQEQTGERPPVLVQARDEDCCGRWQGEVFSRAAVY